MVDLSFSRDCTNKNELENSLKKSNWPPGSREWLGILADDVSRHLEQSFSSFQSAVVRIICILAQPVRKAPQGAPPQLGS